MEKMIKYSNHIGLVLALCAIMVSGCSCSAPKTTPPPDPLAGFYRADEADMDKNKAITDDYKTYIHSLSSDEQKYAGPILFYEDGTGQHAVDIEIGINGTSWKHILIYDKNDKRINTIKYSTGRYAS